jgi:hypothetical protein
MIHSITGTLAQPVLICRGGENPVKNITIVRKSSVNILKLWFLSFSDIAKEP